MTKLTYDDAVQVLLDKLHPGQLFGAGDMVVLSGGSKQAVKTHLSKMIRQGLVAKNDDGTFTVVVDPPTMEDRVKTVIQELAASTVDGSVSTDQVAYNAGVSQWRIREMIEKGSLENVRYAVSSRTGRPSRNYLVDSDIARRASDRAAALRSYVRGFLESIRRIEQEISDTVNRAGAAVWPDGVPLSDTEDAAELRRLVDRVARNRRSAELEDWKTALDDAKKELEELGELSDVGEIR